MRSSLLLFGTFILTAICSFPEYAVARDRHAGPSQSQESTPSKFESESNADGVDQEVLFRRIEDTRELAKILNVPFNKNFLDKAIDFYAQRGMLTDDPKVTEDDIRGFLKEVAGKTDTESLVKVGKEFVQEKQQEFRSEQGRPDRDRDGDGDRDRDDDRRDGRRGGRDRDGDGRRGSRIGGLMEKMGAELKELEKIEKELSKGLSAQAAAGAKGTADGATEGSGGPAGGPAANLHKPGSAPTSENATAPKDLKSQIAGTPTAATFVPAPAVSFTTVPAPLLGQGPVFNDPFVSKPKVEPPTAETKPATAAVTPPPAINVEPVAPSTEEKPIASIANRLIPRGKSIAAAPIATADLPETKPVTNAAAIEALPITPPTGAASTIPLAQNDSKSLLPPQEMEDALDSNGQAVELGSKAPATSSFAAAPTSFGGSSENYPSSPPARAAKIVTAGNKVSEPPKSLIEKFRAVIGMENRRNDPSVNTTEPAPKREISRYTVMAETSFLPHFDSNDFPAFIAQSEHPWLVSLSALTFLAACAAVPYYFRRKRRTR